MSFKSGTHTFTGEFACMTFNFIDGITFTGIDGLNKLLRQAYNTLCYSWETRPSFNDSSKQYPLLARYWNTYYYGQPIDISLFIFDINRQSIFNFSSSGYFTYQSKYLNYSDLILKLPDNLPVMVDNYQQYLNSTKAVRDTSLSVARDNAIFSGVQGFGSGVVGLSAGIATGSANTAGTGLINTIFNPIGAYLGYRHKKQRLQAQLEDAKKTNPNMVSFSSNKEYVLYKGGNIQTDFSEQGRNFKAYSGWCTWKPLDSDSIKSLNNIIYLYGTVNPTIDTLANQMSYQNTFNYLLFDKDHTETIFQKLTNVAVIPSKYHARIVYEMTEGIRFWNTEPNYL